MLYSQLQYEPSEMFITLDSTYIFPIIVIVYFFIIYILYFLYLTYTLYYIFTTNKKNNYIPRDIYVWNDKNKFYNNYCTFDSKYITKYIFFRRIGVTQFSPTYARRAFPCMDEPYLKAEFQIRIGHHKDQNATSNTPVESIQIKLVYDFLIYINIKREIYI